MYFIDTASNKYSLTEDDLFTAYSNTVLKTIDNIISQVFEGRSSLKTYMHTIFHNNCVDLIRKNSSTKYAVNRTESFTDILYNLSDNAKSVVEVMTEQTDMGLLKKNTGAWRPPLKIFRGVGFNERFSKQSNIYETQSGWR
jgi:RNA polymerase sigma-70 factor (ECF subfamily)